MLCTFVGKSSFGAHVHTPAYDEKLSISSNFLLLVSSYKENLSNFIPSFFIHLFISSLYFPACLLCSVCMYVCACACLVYAIISAPGNYAYGVRDANHVPSLQHLMLSRPSRYFRIAQFDSKRHNRDNASGAIILCNTIKGTTVLCCNTFI